MRGILVAAAASAILSFPGATVAQEAGKAESFGEKGAACANLQNIDFANVEDAPASVLLSKPVKGENTYPDYCNVEGYVWRNVKFQIKIPLDDWNGKMLVVGQGGQAGSFATYILDWNPNGILEQGYALVLHDAGHYSGETESLWGWHNPAAMIDYGFRGGHVANVIGKAVLRKFSGEAPRRAYYHSCSNGGREAMMMSQRYPWDYDGIIAGAPTWSYSDAFINSLWMYSLLKGQGKDGKIDFDYEAAQTLHKAVVAQCDTIDGEEDGIINDPRLCKVDLAAVTCKNGRKDKCISPKQADIARKIYEGPRDSDGRQITSPSAMPGSELFWYWAPVIENYIMSVLRYLAFDPPAGPDFQPDRGDIAEYAKRMSLMDSLFSADNPDLRDYKAAGGKLLIYYGWNDQIFGTLDTIDYYETVERVMGGRKNTQDFFRLFMIPGMGHCTGGEGAYVFDYLDALDKWVEHDIAPDALTGYHPDKDGSPKFTRTIKAYRSDQYE